MSIFKDVCEYYAKCKHEIAVSSKLESMQYFLVVPMLLLTCNYQANEITGLLSAKASWTIEDYQDHPDLVQAVESYRAKFEWRTNATIETVTPNEVSRYCLLLLCLLLCRFYCNLLLLLLFELLTVVVVAAVFVVIEAVSTATCYYCCCCCCLNCSLLLLMLLLLCCLWLFLMFLLLYCCCVISWAFSLVLVFFCSLVLPAQ